jgi:hypothetical protein
MIPTVTVITGPSYVPVCSNGSFYVGVSEIDVELILFHLLNMEFYLLRNVVSYL